MIDAIVDRRELRDYLAPKFAKFWLPDGYAFVDGIPRSSTGKMLKASLREQFRDYMRANNPGPGSAPAPGR
jgi:fatty-acyl-CoA synthase